MRLACCIALLILYLPATLFTQQSVTPGDFDYYRLTLSWSPEYCHSNPMSPECSGGHHFGFVVHGLWPEFRNGGYPEHCSNAPGPSDPASYLDIMPDLGLIQHEWSAHMHWLGCAVLFRFDEAGLQVNRDPQAVFYAYEVADGKRKTDQGSF
jgi:hypothetical protein